MSHEADTKKARLNGKSWLLLLASVVILPVCLLLPFMDHSNQLKPALAGAKPGCTSSATLLTHNQCATWSVPHSIWPMAVLFLIALVLFGVGVNAYAARLAHRAGRRFANYRFATVVLVSILGFVAFTIMRGASQNHDSSGSFGLVPYSLAQDGGSTGGPYALVSTTRFGYGLTPLLVVLLIAGFVLPAFVSWHQFIYSRNHIDGQKKQELFQ